MKITTLVSSALLLANSVLANNPIPNNYFTDNGGLAAAQAAAPMWYMAAGTCMPSAAEDGQGHQTNGVDTDNCNILKLNNNCPPEPRWQGANTFYGNVAGEPFTTIPTYWAASRCGSQWKIVYYVYFKKDTGHKSDWEGAVISFNQQSDGTWVRASVAMEQDGNHPSVSWGDLNDTFDDYDDWEAFTQKNKNHPKLYFSKWHHSVHHDWHTSSFKNTCPPTSANDFRNSDYQFWSLNNLRPVSVLNPSWQWGQALSPANFDVCTF